MEIFFVGLIIVALMVYASTKMKKFTASAFEAETIDAEDFSLVKPEGFLHVISGESKFEFYAYSKEFGKDDATEEMRCAEIFIKVFANQSIKQIRAGIKNAPENILLNEEKSGLIKVEKTISEIEVLEFYKIAETENSTKVYELKISVLKEFVEDYQARIDETFASFSLK